MAEPARGAETADAVRRKRLTQRIVGGMGPDGGTQGKGIGMRKAECLQRGKRFPTDGACFVQLQHMCTHLSRRKKARQLSLPRKAIVYMLMAPPTAV